MHTAADIEEWLITAIARETQSDKTSVNPAKSVHALGIDSALVISITFDLEDKFGVLLEPTALFQDQSLRAFAVQLAQRIAEKPPVP
jgi:acyl carrier protein